MIKSIPLRIQKIFLGSAFISFLKAIVGIGIISILSNSNTGSLTLYGNLQNLLTILIAFLGLSIQNGISDYVARKDRLNQASQIKDYLFTALFIGSFLLCTVYLATKFFFQAKLNTLILFQDLSPIVLIIALCGVLHLYYRAIMVGKGFVVFGQSLDLLRSSVILLSLFLYLIYDSKINIYSVIFFGYLIIIPFILLALFKSLSFKPKIRIDKNLSKIIKTGLITGYSGILLSITSIAIRSFAVDEGGYSLSDSWELSIKLLLVFQVVMIAPLSQILLRTYALADSRKPLTLFKKAIPFVLLVPIFMALIPSSFYVELLFLLFSMEIPSFKMIFIIMIIGETFRVLGTFFHNYLVSNALIVPQAIFETLAQLLLLTIIIYFSSSSFLLIYAVGIFVSGLFWMLINMFYLNYGHKKNLIEI